VTPANLLYLAGCVTLLRRQRKATLRLGYAALAVGILGALPCLLIVEFLQHPAYYAWLGSFIVLVVGGHFLPPPRPAPPA
jgi:hypothetical protein